MAVETTFDIGFGTKFDPTNLEEGLSKALARAEKETENSAAKQVAAVAKGALEEVKAVKAAESKKVEERKKSTQEQIELIRAMPDLTKAQKERQVKAAEEAGRKEVATLEGNMRARLRLIQESVTDEVNAINEGADLKSRSDAVYESARKEAEVRRRAADERLDEIRRISEEEAAAIRERTDIAEAEKQKQVDAATEAARQESDAVRAGLKEQLDEIEASADARVKIIRESSRRQRRELENGNGGKLKSIRNFSDEAGRSLGGFMGKVTKALKSPVALGAAVVLAGRQMVRFLNSTAEAWRKEEQAQIALAAAARNNPYLNDHGVHQLRRFASEMQRLTGIDNVQVMGAQTRLASLGRNQREIEKIVRTAADIAATGLMSYDQAVDELSNSFSGFTRRLERMFPELKNLTEEAKKAGEAVNVIAANVSGMAEQAMRSGTGSVEAFNNAMESLRRTIGQDWERVLRGPRGAITMFMNQLVQTRGQVEELNAATNAYSRNAIMSNRLRVYEAELKQLRETMEWVRGFEEGGAFSGFVASTIGTKTRNLTGGRGVNVWNHGRVGGETAARIAELEEMTAAYNRSMEALTEMYAARNRADAALAMVDTDEAKRAVMRIESNFNVLHGILQSGGDLGSELARDLMEAIRHNSAIVDAEVKRIEQEREHQKIRAENLEYLEREIEMITQRAQIEGRGTRTLEVQRRVLDARINAYTNLVRQVGAAGEAERRMLEELQREYLRLEIETANRLQKENRQALENRRREIETMAELEGRATDSIRTQNELLDANINAYQNQMRILRDLIDGTREHETARRAALEVQWRQYAQEKQTARAQRARLNDMIRLQDEVNQRVGRIHDETQRYFDEHQYRQELGRILRYREQAEWAAGEDRRNLEKEALRKYTEFRLDRLRAALKEEREIQTAAIYAAEADGEAEGGFERARELRDRLRQWEEVEHIRTVNEIGRLYSGMMEDAYGEGSRQRISDLADMQIEELRRVQSAWEEWIKVRHGWESNPEFWGDNGTGWSTTMVHDRETGESRVYTAAEMEQKAQEEIARIREAFERREYEARKAQEEKLLSLRRASNQEIMDAMNEMLSHTESLAHSISTIWTNNIDRQMQERLRANDAMDQSDEKRRANEQKIVKKAAFERHRAELFAWSANVTFATAQAGLAALTAFTEGLKGGGPAAVAIASIKKGLAVAAGAAQVAAIISAKPTPPRFHTGTASVPGRTGQEVPAILMAGETVLPQGDFRNVMQAFANMAKAPVHASAQPTLSVRVENYAARDTTASASLDAKGLKIVVEKMVGDAVAKGRLEPSFDRRDSRNRGQGVNTF